MSIRFRQYKYPHDYMSVDNFLIEHYQADNADGNWIEPTWEYMCFHPMLDSSSLEKIRIWEDIRKIVAVVHYESRLGEAFFQFHPAYRHLNQQMLDYAEENLHGESKETGKKYLRAYVNETDEDFLSLVRDRGYQEDVDSIRPLYKFVIPNRIPIIQLPNGFHLTSLAEECDWEKVHRVLWRGFNHQGEPPAGETELEERRKMFDTPNGRRELKIAIKAPDGNFVAFCGVFYEATHKIAYVEPVATDPDYRRLGLGKAAVLEGIRRCGLMGADVAYVGSDQSFYQALGFRKVYNSQCWLKYLDGD